MKLGDYAICTALLAACVVANAVFVARDVVERFRWRRA
jgi:hypothetical protein